MRIEFTPDPALYPFTSQWFDSSKGRVHYVDEGTGPVILLCHGNPTWSFLYRDIIRDLKDFAFRARSQHPADACDVSPTTFWSNAKHYIQEDAPLQLMLAVVGRCRGNGCPAQVPRSCPAGWAGFGSPHPLAGGGFWYSPVGPRAGPGR
jgi:hypothetical protein